MAWPTNALARADTVFTSAEAPAASPLAAAANIVSAEWLTRHAVCPVAAVPDGSLRVVITADTNPHDIADLRVAVGSPFSTKVASRDELERAIERFRRIGQADAVDAYDESTHSTADADARGLATQPPVVRYVNLLVREAVAQDASDIHLDATRTGLVSRLRVDGMLAEGPAAPAGMHHAIVSRCKLLAGLDIAERRKPQDGRIRMRLEESELDLRVSTVPTLHGESVVIRLLERASRPVALRDLGMPDTILAHVHATVARPHGMLLITGPTGSGKTTTLYAALATRNAATEKLITVEDPVEYQLHGVTQVPVHHAAGVSFASALRAILRQDPDVLLIGELRDAETASVAVQAAMTGHLVLATLHTNDALSAVARMIDLGVPAYLLVDTLNTVIAQRLVRRICRGCIEAVTPDVDELRWLDAHGVEAPGHLHRGAGCVACRGTGFRGRVGVFESVEITPALRAAIAREAGHDELARVADAAGQFSPMRSDGIAKAFAGVTTLAEVRRAVVV